MKLIYVLIVSHNFSYLGHGLAVLLGDLDELRVFEDLEAGSWGSGGDAASHPPGSISGSKGAVSL